MTTRLKCMFRVENDGKAMGRTANGFVAFGCERKGLDDEERANKMFYLLLTTRTNKGHPRKIKLDHFHCLFDKMKRNGMATLQFAEPNLTVYVSQADPKKLCQFLLHLHGLLRHRNAIDSCCSSQSLCSSPSMQMPLSSPQCCQAIPTVSTVHRQCASAITTSKPTKICIQSRQQYQSMIKQGSTNLHRLDIVGIGFRTVDLRWFGMRRLQQLSLVGNKLGANEWCTERNWRQFCAISKLEQLNTLDLSQNEFKHLPEMFIDALPVSIVNLNLASNHLVRLTNRISRLQQLNTLRLDYNPFEELPEDLCLIASLCQLSLVGLEQLQFLPQSLCVVKISISAPPRFTLLDISDNDHSPFITGHRKCRRHNSMVNNNASVSSISPSTLCELAAAAVLNNKKLLVCPGASCLLRPSVTDCLPASLCLSMRQWLRRCAYCYRLFTVLGEAAAPSMNAPVVVDDDKEQFKRVDLRRCATSFYGTHSWAFFRVQLCVQCK